MTARLAARLLAASLLLLASSCAVTMDVPDGFVRVDEPGFRAVSADHARVVLREFDAPAEGSLQFWTDALRHDFTEQRGLAIADSGTVADAQGRIGNWLQCTANVRGERVGYLVAIWADDDTIRTAEFTAQEPVFRERVGAVRAALATVR